MRWFPLLLLALVACQTIQPVPYDPPTLTSPNDTVRPDIPRTYTPPPEPTITEQPTGGEQVPPAPDIIPHLTLEVPFGSAIGAYHPIVTAEDFPLLRHRPIERNPGTIVQYKEEILFWKNGTGKPTFGQDEDTDAIGTFLTFDEGGVAFEYRVRIDGGTFEGLQGRTIGILGHTYLIAEASNRTVSLYGQDIASNLLFDNGTQLVVDSKTQADTEVRVLPNMISYRLIANGDDIGNDIVLAPGESLGEHVGQGKLASLLFDIRYAGSSATETDRITLEENKFGYVLSYDGPDGPVAIPLVEQDAGRIVLGKAEEPLRTKPCASGKYCIAPGDLVLLITPDRRAYVLSYSDISEQPATLIMRAEHNRYQYDIVGNLSREAWTDVIIGDIAFRARIGPKDNATGDRNISIALPATPELATAHGLLIRPKDIIANRTLPLEIVVPASRTITRKEEKISVNVTYDGEWHIVVGGNITFARNDRTDDVLGQTPYGIGLLLRQRHEDLPLNEAKELTMLLPAEQSLGLVRLEG